jgi:hypothetical protein
MRDGIEEINIRTGLSCMKETMNKPLKAKDLRDIMQTMHRDS